MERYRYTCRYDVVEAREILLEKKFHDRCLELFYDQEEYTNALHFTAL
jgi:hypothetical protein